MVDVIKRGAYLVDNRIVWADEAAPDPAGAREKTMAYAILRSHAPRIIFPHPASRSRAYWWITAWLAGT